RYMVRAEIDPQAAVKLLNIFEGQEMLSPSRQDPYARSHPLSRDRNRTIKNLVSVQKKTFEPDLNAQYWFDRARGKLSAFIRSPKWTFQTLDDGKADDIRLMRKAVAYFRRSDLPRAKKALEAVIKLRPDDGYLYDLYGEILLKSRAPKQSIKAYRTAVSLVPENGIILGGLGRALLADGRAKSALPILE
ncbi:MAG: tetratricopeptide repeat protein, partial [Rhodobacterales bacterium]